tara:strand:- start:69 stop:239 length:171 start_codon:yes stop_codon:yes gene_type:complete
MLLAAATRVLCCTVTALPGTKAEPCVENMLSAMRLSEEIKDRFGRIAGFYMDNSAC